MSKIVVDSDKLFEGLNSSIGITAGNRIPDWLWKDALSRTEHTDLDKQKRQNYVADKKKALKRKYHSQYYGTHVKFAVNLSKKKDPDLIEWMEKQENIAGTLRSLIAKAARGE